MTLLASSISFCFSFFFFGKCKNFLLTFCLFQCKIFYTFSHVCFCGWLGFWFGYLGLWIFFWHSDLVFWVVGVIALVRFVPTWWWPWWLVVAELCLHYQVWLGLWWLGCVCIFKCLSHPNTWKNFHWKYFTCKYFTPKQMEHKYEGYSNKLVQN